MLRKNLIRLSFGLLALALAFVVTAPVVAFAANTDHTDFVFEIYGDAIVGTTDHTYARNKIDSSTSYAKAISLSDGLVVGVAGINNYSLGATNRTDNTYAYFRSTYHASSIMNTVYGHEYYAWRLLGDANA